MRARYVGGFMVQGGTEDGNVGNIQTTQFSLKYGLNKNKLITFKDTYGDIFESIKVCTFVVGVLSF